MAFLELAPWTREGEELNGRDSSPLGAEREPALARAAAVARCRQSRPGVQVPTGGFGLDGRERPGEEVVGSPASFPGRGGAVGGCPQALWGAVCTVAWPQQVLPHHEKQTRNNQFSPRGAAWLPGEQGASPGRLAERCLLRWLGGQGF